MYMHTYECILSIEEHEKEKGVILYKSLFAIPRSSELFTRKIFQNVDKENFQSKYVVCCLERVTIWTNWANFFFTRLLKS